MPPQAWLSSRLQSEEGAGRGEDRALGGRRVRRMEGQQEPKWQLERRQDRRQVGEGGRKRLEKGEGRSERERGGL